MVSTILFEKNVGERGNGPFGVFDSYNPAKNLNELTSGPFVFWDKHTRLQLP